MEVAESLWAEVTAETARLRAVNPLVLGCRFLYSGRDTLTMNNGLLLAGMNPGKERDMSDRPWTENGRNAYLFEEWTRSRFQFETMWFMKRVFAEFGLADVEAALNSTMTSNFIPFRTAQFSDFGGQAAAVRSWAEDFWSRIIPLAGIRAIVACGVPATKGFAAVAKRLNNGVSVVGIPHASRAALGDSELREVLAKFSSVGFAPTSVLGA